LDQRLNDAANLIQLHALGLHPDYRVAQYELPGKLLLGGDDDDRHGCQVAVLSETGKDLFATGVGEYQVQQDETRLALSAPPRRPPRRYGH